MVLTKWCMAKAQRNRCWSMGISIPAPQSFWGLLTPHTHPAQQCQTASCLSLSDVDQNKGRIEVCVSVCPVWSLSQTLRCPVHPKALGPPTPLKEMQADKLSPFSAGPLAGHLAIKNEITHTRLCMAAFGKGDARKWKLPSRWLDEKYSRL